MAIKKLITMSAIGVAMGIMSSAAVAGSHGGMVPNYVTNPYGEVIKNSYGECWRDRFAETDVKLEECGYPPPVVEVIEEPEMVAVIVEEPCPDLVVISDLKFGFDSTQLTEEDKASLMDEAALLRRVNEGKCQRVSGAEIIGHTDSTGPEEYNMQLSIRRAEAVKQFMIDQGIQGELVVVGMGESQPVADNSTKEGRAENRRVVIDLIEIQMAQ